MSKYLLSPNAVKSLEDIKTYSTNYFGEQQTDLYLNKLRDSFRLLASHPHTGHKRDDIKKGYYSYFSGSHMIYYKIYKDHIEIIDILHKRMDPILNL